MAVSLKDYLKNNKTVQAAQKKATAAQNALVQLQNARVGVPGSAGPAITSSLDRRIAAAQAALDAANVDLVDSKNTATAYYNSNVVRIEARQEQKQVAADRTRLSDAYAMRDRLIAANQPTVSIDTSIKDLNDKINKTGKYAPKKTTSGTTVTPGEEGAVELRDYAKEASTVGTAIAQMSGPARRALSEALAAANYKVPISENYSDALKNAYAQAIIDNQVRSTDFNKEIPLEEFLQIRSAEGPGTGGSGGGSILPDNTGTQDIYTKDVAKGIINELYQGLFSRDATSKEVSSLYKQLNAAQKDIKNIDKITYKMVNGRQIAVRETGLDPRMFLKEIIKSTPEWKESQQAKTEDALSDLRSVAVANGLDLEKNFGSEIAGWTERLANGEKLDIFKTAIRNAARATLPEKVRNSIDPNLDLRSALSVYVNSYAKSFGIPTDQVPLSQIQSMAITENGFVPVGEFEKKKKSLPEWALTPEAKSEVADVTTTVLKNFGFMG